MSTNNDQNGCQPSTSQQTAPPTDPRIRVSNTSSSTNDAHDGICRDYVWGICTKGSQCKYRHVLNPENMKTILKFCHDFQNRSGCTRQGCTYLHTSNAEETLFLTAGVIPKVLRDRYAASNLYYNDCISQPPPPPPPLPPPNVLQATGAQQPPPLPAPLPSLLAPPPPPPPPTISTASILVTPPMFTGPHQGNSSFPIPESTIRFDASKPPPPLPCKNGAIKRPAEPAEAGPSKRRQIEVEHSLCEACIEREWRIDIFRKKIEKLECERECQTFLLQKKSETFANGKLLLKSAVGPDLFHIVDAYIEQSTSPLEQVNDAMSQISQMNSLVSGPSSSSSLLQSQIMNMMDLARNIVEGPRTNTFPNNQERTKQTLIEMLRNASSSSQSSSSIATTANLPNRTQSVVEPHRRTYSQKRLHAPNLPHPLVAVQARNVQNGTGPQIASPLVQNITHQPSVIYPQNASQNAITQNAAHLQHATHLQNAIQPPNTFATMPLRPTQSQNLRQQNAVHPQVAMPPIYPGLGEYQTAAPPPPRPYCPTYAGVCSNGGVGYNAPIRGVSSTAVVPTTVTPPQYSYIPQYPHHQ